MSFRRDGGFVWLNRRSGGGRRLPMLQWMWEAAGVTDRAAGEANAADAAEACFDSLVLW
jgi:hypothetical protein